jgi:hypothetical protein
MQRKKIALGFVIGITLFLSLWVQLPRILDSHIIEEDFRNLFWVNLYGDSNLYQNDLLVETQITPIQIGSYELAYANSNPLYGFLFQLATPFFSPILFSKLLIFPLILIAVIYFYLILYEISPKSTAFAATITFVLFLLASHSAISVVGGLQRSFTYPILLGLLYHLIKRQYALAAFFVFLSGVIYPPIFPISALTYSFSCIQTLPNSRWHFQIQWRPLLMLIIVCFGVVFLLFLSLQPLLNKIPTPATNQSIPTPAISSINNYGKGGIVQLFHLFPLIGRGGLASGIMDGVHIFILTLLALVVVIERRGRLRRLPTLMRHLFLASVVLFFLSWLAFLVTDTFLLYLPSRYTQAVIPLLLLVLIMLNIGDTLKTAVSWLTTYKNKIMWLVLPIILIALGAALLLPGASDDEAMLGRSPTIRWLLLGLTGLLLLLSFLFWRQRQGKPKHAMETAVTTVAPSPKMWLVLGIGLIVAGMFYVNTVQRVFYKPTPQQRSLYTFVETLPKEALFSGEPCLLDDIPLYAKRTTIMSCEPRGYDKNTQLVWDTLISYYTDDIGDIVSYCADYHIDYLLVDTNRYTPEFLEAGQFYYEPYNSEITAWLNGRSHFALLNIPDEQKLFQQENLFVIPCTPEALQTNAS